MQQEAKPREIARSMEVIQALRRRREISELIRRKAMQQLHRPGR
jgi:hypothetical protein